MNKGTIQKSLIYKEFEPEKAREWFHYTRYKFISHVDTFYYTVKAAGEWGFTLGSVALLSALTATKDEAVKKKEAQPFLPELYPDLIVKPYFGFHMYKYGISKEDHFDIFVAPVVPNRETSEIVVQLRSQFIWLRGLSAAYDESLACLMAIVNKYGIEISSIAENRMDFAYHTNYIQDMLSFFKDENLGQMQVSSFKRWGKEGNFLGDEIYNDYISLGRRKSDNAFVRIYNKSKEVIELGYKQFFVPIWQKEGLISLFDRYIFDRIFDDGKQSWNYKETARCRFYLEYGSDDAIKSKIRRMLESPDTSVLEFKRIADCCVPDLTNIVNIEIQLKRKFTKALVLPRIEYPDKLPLIERRMYKILRMLQSIRDYITYDTIRFVKYKGEYADMRRERRPTADWWKRLSACGELDGIHYDLCRDYQLKYDMRRCKLRSLSQIAAFASLYEDFGEDSSFSLTGDLSDILGYLNDNDLEKYRIFRTKKRLQMRLKFERDLLWKGGIHE